MIFQNVLDPAAIVIFGASGDLTKRKLLPALYRMVKDGNMPEKFAIIGVARTASTKEEYQALTRTALEASSEVGTIDEAAWARFSAALDYQTTEFGNKEQFQALRDKLEAAGFHNWLFYCSVPPSVFPIIAEQLAATGLNDEDEGYTRIIVEKPFGTSLETAKSLNTVLHAAFKESQIYRIDHFLGKETVQNILSLRFANTIFEPLWNRTYVDHVQITVAENLGLEGRGGFYEEAGVLRDMMQNHVMQLLTLIAMEPPVSSYKDGGFSLGANALRDEKVKVIQSLRPLTDPAAVSILGQYAAGTILDKKGVAQAVPGYLQEDKVAPESKTATYFAIKVEVDNWRWAGVPFFVRSGKRLPVKNTEITIVFKRPPLNMFPKQTSPNQLILHINPDEGISLRFDAKVPGLDSSLRVVEMDFNYRDNGDLGPAAYERLILDALLGDASLFPREDEVVASWAWIQPLLDAALNPETYAAGSWGPNRASEFMGSSSDGLTRTWRELPAS
jgi:glucose-6-phosphate 1-dehydrogenase